MKSLISRKDIEVPYPSEDDRRADDQRIKDSVGLEGLDIPLSLLRRIHNQLRLNKNDIVCFIGRNDKGYKIIDVNNEESYSFGLDLGTTNLVAVLYDNTAHESVLEIKTENPQITFGSDILTRMHRAMGSGAEEVYRSIIEGINDLIKKACNNAGVNKENVHAMAVAGNTAMSHFFLGLDIGTIPVAPFVPVIRKPGFFSASELKIDVNPEALVYVFPNAGSYVGGDIIAGIIASGMSESDELSVLIDVGTNAEIVVGNRDWLLVGAGAAGPALEEGISMIGKRAGKGIIYDVEIKRGIIDCRTFDNAQPQGICGSGMVSLIYEMHRAGMIGDDGMLNPEQEDVVTSNGYLEFALSCGSGDTLRIKQDEIDNFLKSKAAMFTLLLVLLRSVGLQFSDIHKVYIAGALGNGINVKKAAGIGMLPEWTQDTIVPTGNASLKGARMLLADDSLPEKIDSITDKITYKHMHDDPEFMREFMGAVFIPHTNPELLKV
ncbi:MAG TPA: DUF4445 domain-containing protein [Nitrospirae bacterium]|nr:DUF4445 domain-containing protein [Nitrospirota bacterium]